MYSNLLKLNGKNCYTLSMGNPAVMDVTTERIICTTQRGTEIVLPRNMVEDAIHRLVTNGRLDVNEVHQEVTMRNRTQTDKLMAVLSLLPGVTWDRRPRCLYYHPESKGG